MKKSTKSFIIGAGLTFGGVVLAGEAKREEDEKKQTAMSIGALALETGGLVMINKGRAEYTADKVAQQVEIKLMDMERAKQAKKKADDVVDVDYTEV